MKNINRLFATIVLLALSGCASEIFPLDVPGDSSAWGIKESDVHILGPKHPEKRAWPFMLAEASSFEALNTDLRYVLLYDRGTRESHLAFSNDLREWEEYSGNPIFAEILESWQGHRAWFRYIYHDVESNRYVAVANGANPEEGIRGVGLFESRDFVSWRPIEDEEGHSVNPVATVDSFEISEGERIYGVWLGRENGLWYLVCQAERVVGKEDYVTVALKSRDLAIWEEVEQKPVFEPKYEWEEGRVRTQGIGKVDDTYWMIYENQLEDMWGVAFSSSIVGEWKRYPDPILIANARYGYERNIEPFKNLNAPTVLHKADDGWIILAAGYYGEGISPSQGQAEITLISSDRQP